MNKAVSIAAIAVVGLLFVATPRSIAQLTEYKWNNPALVGAQSWQVNGNWDLAGFPNDPGRTEPDATVIVPSIGANTSVALAGNLSLDVGASNVTVASLTLGGTAGAVTTNITSSGGKLVFENYEANNTTASPDICAFNCGAALVTSGGVAGSTNVISAPIHINGERLEFAAASTNNLTISGPITFANLAAPASGSSIRSYMPAGTKLTISGTISLVDTVTTVGASLTIFDNGTLPSPALPAESVNNLSTGTIEISGVIQDTGSTTGTGGLFIGNSSAPPTTQLGTLATIILSGTNTYRGATALQRANLVLANNSALGVDSSIGDDRNGGASFSGNQNPSNQFGFNMLSNDDSRTISVDARISQWLTITGTHSLTWAGTMTQANSRGLANILPAGKTFTTAGATYASSVSASDTSFENRIWVYDGTGTTVSTGGWRNKIKGGVAVNDGTLGHFRKTGTGTVLVSDPGAVSDFTGDVIVDQGVIRFSADTVFDSARLITSTGGAIGVDTGTFTNSTLLQKLESTDHGGLMLTEAEAAANISIDFTAGDLVNATNMSVAAPQGGASYNGTITPAADAVTSVPTYRLGGGNGKLTIPGAKLTGARDVQVTNGGEVELDGANTYSGVTKIQAKYHTTKQQQAIANTATNVSDYVYEGTTLTANNLASGASSSVGGASDAASNMVIQGSTLKYKHTGAGSNGTTNRLFTVGTGGATLESASSDSANAMRFTNTGALEMDVAENRTGTYADTGTAVSDGVSGTFSTRARLQFDRTDDLVTGMGLSGLTLTDPLNPSNTTTLPAGAAITQVNSAINNPSFTYSSNVTFNPAVANTFPGYFGTGTVTIAGVARTLTLTGANTGNNTLNPLIADAAAAAGTNTVNVAKNGTGKWILTGNNTYTGTTTVNAGTLLINGAQTGAGLATVAAGATLGGTGTLGGALTNNGIVSPGASVGTLSVNGNTIMGANSHLAIELLGATADKLAVTGNFDLSALGNFLDVTGVGSGTSWIIATYTGALTGTFETISSGYSVNYGSGANSQITLNAIGSPGVAGDYNGNGVVDSADYVVWKQNQGLLSGGTPSTGDGDGDGDVDSNDYQFWRARFGNTSGAGAVLSSSAVPEPASILLIGLVVTALLGGVRRRS